MASRPKGFGMTAELQRKKDAKYDPELERQAIDWIEAVLGEKALGGASGQDGVHAALKDGIILCRVANALGGSIKFNQSKMAFKMMENIGKFLDFADKLGVPKSDMFQTVDLYEKQNMPGVINGIHALGRKAHSTGKTPHPLGPKEASANKREFTEEQLKSGQNVIGLQMGTNKGASQAGDHFGRPRQVAGANVYK
ncbi:muscle-specific protein 20-like [Actinia tenebrosa]|uniref:Transgelin n=1 Tax=Actinia tenebrosa TaxID=6105 RepID=A0A6P8HBT5_ACTTE|nr:muscle-specific protein 20-like [Actinia tenebrosa]